MFALPRSKPLLLATLVTLPLLAGCSRVNGIKGYVAEKTLVEGVQAGVDNRDSVVRTLGRPTFTSQFGDADWYYVTRKTSNYIYRLPATKDQSVLHIHFDAQGNVALAEKNNLSAYVNIHPDKDQTPTLGRNQSILNDLFGNIGTVGTGAGGGSGGGPNGGGGGR